MPLPQDQQDKLNQYLLSMKDLPNNQPDMASEVASAVGKNAPSAVQSPTPSVQPPTPEVSNDDRTQDANPGHLPEDIAKATPVDPLTAENTSKMAQVDEYGPEQQKAVMDAILKEHGSIQNRASRGLAGLGDALMANAGKSSPGFLGQVNEREGRMDKLKSEMTPQLQKMNAEQMGQKQALELQDSSTPMGKAAADFLRPTLMQVFPGKSPAEYDRMLRNPSMAASNMGIPAQVLESKAKLAMANAELGLHEDVAKNTAENNKEQTRLEEEKNKQGALKELKDMPWYSRLFHPDIAGKLEKDSGLNEDSGSGWKYIGKVK